jgi:xylulokinase
VFNALLFLFKMMSKESVFMGIDLGTSSLKLVLIDSQLRLIFSFNKEYAIQSSAPGFAEHDPEIWIFSLETALNQVSKFMEINHMFLEGIGITGQMHTLVCLDRNFKPVRNAILWSDQRSVEIVERLNFQFGKNQWKDWIANPIAVGFSFPSWMWIRENDKNSAQKIRYLLQPKDYIRLWLTGELCTDSSDASATGFFHPGEMNWSPTVLEMAGLKAENFPKVKPSLEVAGILKPELSKKFGFSYNIPVIVGGGDQAIQALAYDITEEGECLITIGSGGQIFSPTNNPTPESELRLNLFNHVVPNTWHYEAATLSAGLSFRWLRSMIRKELSFQQMADQASKVEFDNNLFFMPYLNGERTPWMNSEMTGAYLGLKMNHKIDQMARALMEGVVFSISQSMDVIRNCGINPQSVIISGGGSKHPFWIQLLANVIGIQVRKTNITEATACGAALAAWIGVRQIDYSTAKNLIQKSIIIEKIFVPDQDQVKLQEKYRRFVEIFPKNKSLLS